MDLSKLEIALRPRSHWEAIDLGFALARRWFLPLLGLWITTALPASLLFFFVADGDLIWISLLLWWFKPAYEPLLVFWLSRAVFGEQLQLKSVRRQWWRITRPQLFANLTWRRLSTNRSFYMPVALLEGLRGKARQQRIAILGRRQHAGTWLTIIGIHFETILEFCFLLGIYFIVPEELRWFEDGSFFFSPGPIDEWLQTFCWLTAMGIIAPFYVAGGFALYLHRRSELEGWDIEINFRRTAERIQTLRRGPTGVLLMALFAFSLFITEPYQAFAEERLGPEESKQRIESVLADPLFGRMEEETYWKYVGNVEASDESPEGLLRILKVVLEIIKGFMRGIADYGEILLWAAGLFTLAFLLYHFSRNSEWMRMPMSRTAGKRKLPTELFGLDVRPDSLPEDIAGEALKQVKAGQLRAALSLLYRGALIRLITEHQLDIPASATEGECLRLVQRHRNTNEADYFLKLTRAWLTTAYAHLIPDARHIEQLCLDWRKVYDHAER